MNAQYEWLMINTVEQFYLSLTQKASPLDFIIMNILEAFAAERVEDETT